VPVEVEIPSDEQLLASAINFLIDGEEHEAATVLLFCSLHVDYSDLKIREVDVNSWAGLRITYGDASFHLTGPRQAYTVLHDTAHPVFSAVNQALRAVAPAGARYMSWDIRAQIIDVEPNWREELRQIAGGRGVHNQAVEIPNREIVKWGNLGFRSESERRIAIALDTTGVLFLPNCLARLGAQGKRVTREADFLICHEGKWGVLEVDGPFHPRAALDHERDRLFKQHGIGVTERFDWETCLNDAPGVVQHFLALLAKNG
jgi:hypothetical protein